MLNSKIVIVLLSIATLLVAIVIPVFAQIYTVGVKKGQYVTYGNFVGTGPGFESFNDYSWLRLEISDVLGKDVSLLSIGQFKNGEAISGNGTVSVWNIELGTENGVPSTQGPIVAANLNQGDAIPPVGTFFVNATETRLFLGFSRSVVVLSTKIFTPDYNTSLSYVYDRVSGMLLESLSQITAQADPQPVTSTFSYSVIDTNIFGSTTTLTPSPSTTATSTPDVSSAPSESASPSPTAQPNLSFPGEIIYPMIAFIILVVFVGALLILRRKKLN